MCITRELAGLLTGAVLVCGVPADAGEVFACRDQSGLLWFTDQPCANAVPVPISAVSVIEGHAPSAAEQRALSELERRAPVQAAGKPGSSTPDRDRGCQAAREGLDALRLQRRRGYALSQAPELDARERLLRADYDRDC